MDFQRAKEEVFPDPGRRRFLRIALGSALAGGIGGVMVGPKIFRLLHRAQPEVSETPDLPQFSIGPLNESVFFPDAIKLYPQLSEAESILKIDLDRFRKDYLAAPDPESKSAVADEFVKSCSDQFAKQHIDGTAYLEGIPRERINQAIVGLLNIFLIKQNGLYLDYDVEENFLNIWRVEKLETLTVTYQWKHYGIIVVSLKDSLFRESDIPGKRFSEAARFEPFPGMIVLFPDEPALPGPANPGLAVMHKKEGYDMLNPAQTEEERESTLNHEGSHALVSQLFHHAHHAMLKGERVPVSINIPFGNGVVWSLRDGYNPHLIDEMCGEAMSLLYNPHGNVSHLFTLFTNGVSLWQYSFAAKYVLYALAAIPELPEGFKKQIVDGLQRETLAMQYEDIQAMMDHPAVTPEKIQRIAEQMWKVGVEILEQMEKHIRAVKLTQP